MGSLVIQPQQEGKGRSFTAALLSYVTADALWSGGQTETDAIRPVWMMVAASEGEAGPFTANLRLGRRASIVGGSSWSRKKAYVELLRSAEYSFATQRFAEGSVVTAYLPDLFRLDPGMVDPSGVRFVVLPSRARLESEALDIEAAVTHLKSVGLIAKLTPPNAWADDALPTEDQARDLVPIAALFAAYLDRRTRAPLVPDLRFYIQLMIACLQLGLASLSAPEHRPGFGQHRRLGYAEHDVAAVGLLPGLAMSASHAEIEQVLAEQVAIYFGRIS